MWLIGFGVCDLLWLEVGLLFYGYDFDEDIDLVCVGLFFVIFKCCWVEGGFFGVDCILCKLVDGILVVCVGFMLDGCMVVCEGVVVLVGDFEVGCVILGGFLFSF